ncbi:hypothetical protein SAMN02746041_01310 [Desulfacinum hydrothermale DSM 13146]|uniref:Uncharacterized protein n=1 Tax=Desulfacinum hydrothermale DSM 13146 TaxID=1121390 RepID=A0A1W1XE43_9BACT|nr:hypothetical protein SAMN02746041_01310 [Desulfacinum hydrothermale DSM 13146]
MTTRRIHWIVCIMVLSFLSILLLNPITPLAKTTLSCKLIKTKHNGQVAWKCIGEDCDQCINSQMRVAGKTCCRCEYTGDFYICRGSCCCAVMDCLSVGVKPISPLKPLRR